MGAPFGAELITLLDGDGGSPPEPPKPEEIMMARLKSLESKIDRLLEAVSRIDNAQLREPML